MSSGVGPIRWCQYWRTGPFYLDGLELKVFFIIETLKSKLA